MPFVLYSVKQSELLTRPSIVALNVTRKGDVLFFETINFDEALKEGVYECVLEDVDNFFPPEKVFLKVPDVESDLTSGSLEVANAVPIHTK
jgi:hypothetical protein